MIEIDFSHLDDALNQLKDGSRTEYIIDPIQAFEQLSNAIRELQISHDTISTLESKLAQETMDLARFKVELDREKALMGEILRQSATGMLS